MLYETVHAALSFISALFAAASPASKSAHACPERYIAPDPVANIRLDPYISTAGHYDLDLELDGVKETCSLEVGTIIPAKAMGDMIRGPLTSIESSCKSVSVTGLTLDGTIPSLATTSGPSELFVRVRQGKTTVGEARQKLSYQPAELLGQGCGTWPRADMTLKLH